MMNSLDMQVNKHYPLLLIGGTDPNGAGLMSDIQVAQSLRCQVNVAVTAVTTQHHDQSLDQLGLITPQGLRAQLESIDLQAIKFVKIGMLGSAALVEMVAQILPPHIKIILDPVIKATSGSKLLDPMGIEAMRALLLPNTALLTPNTHELAVLSGYPIASMDDVGVASAILLNLGVNAVLAKGGHIDGEAKHVTDFYHTHEQQYYLSGTRWVDRINVRGTGCAVATAIACYLNQGERMEDALVMAKAAMSQAIEGATFDGKAYRAHHTGLARHYRYLPKLYSHAKPVNHHFTPCDTLWLGVYPVVDSVKWIKKLVPLGIKTIQLRLKDAHPKKLNKAIRKAVKYCAPQNIRLFINDHWALAIKQGAYGVHLGQEDIKSADLKAIAKAGLRLGLSSHCWSEVARAMAIGPSYLALGPVFATTSKVMPWQPQGVEAVAKWVEFFDDALPLVAIGGIDIERAKKLRTTGVGSVAMISAITQASDYQQATRDLLAVWEAS